jgi:hypothetical protein
MKLFFHFLVMGLSISFAQAQNRPVITLDMARALETPGKCVLSTIASEVRYVPLEAKPGSYIQNIDKYAISKDLILVADNKAGKVMKFDREGKYLGDFMVKGKGPKEFIWIYGIDFNSRGEVLVSKDGSGIDIFSKEGVLINGFNHNGLSTARWLTDDQILVVEDYMLTNGKIISLIDRTGRQLSTGLRTKMDLSGLKSTHYYSLANCAEGFYYWDPLFDTVYTIDRRGGVYPRTVFRHRKDHITQKDWLTGVYNEKLISGEGYDIVGYYEFKGKFMMMAIANQYNCILEFDQSGGQGQVRHKSIYFGLWNDLDRGPAFFPRMVLADGSAVSFLRPQEDLIHYIDWDFTKSGKAPPESYDLKVYQKLADYGNPVLMIVK